MMSQAVKDKLHKLQQEVEPYPLYDMFDGVVLPRKFAEYRSKIENLEVRDDDVWVCTFPKSGTTWTQEMVWLIANNLDYEGAKIELDERFSFLEMFTLIPPSMDILHYPDPIVTVNKITGRRFIKTHLPWQFLPLQIRNSTRKPKIVYVIRNVKDVCVSFFHHHNSMTEEPIELKRFFELFLTDKYMFSPYWDNIFGYWNNRHLPNLLILKYEDMIEDLAAVIRKTAAFLETTVSDNEMAKLVKHLSFSEMKKNAAVNKESIIAAIPSTNSDRSAFMRKGRAGGYKDELDEYMTQLLDVWIELNMTNTDFRCDF